MILVHAFKLLEEILNTEIATTIKLRDWHKTDVLIKCRYLNI